MVIVDALDKGKSMNPNTDDRLLLTVPEAARRLGMGRSFIYELVSKGEIKSIKLGRSRRIPVSALEEFIEAKLSESIDEASTGYPAG